MTALRGKDWITNLTSKAIHHFKAVRLLSAGALALLVMVACGGSTEVPASPVPLPSMVFTVPTSVPSTVVDEPPTEELRTPTLNPTAAPLPTPKPTSAAYPTATPYPTATAYPTATPYPTVKPDSTAAPAPNPTATPLPTPTPDPTATPTPSPTAAPQPTYTPAPTYTPRPTYVPVLPPTPTPTPTPERLKAYSNLNDKWGYTINAPAGWKMDRSGKEMEIQSRDGQVVVEVFVKEYPDKRLPQSRFAEEQLGAVIARHVHSSEYFDINLMEQFKKGGHDRYRFAWRWQPDADSCVMDIVDIIFRSFHFPARFYGYVVRVSICSERLDAYFKVREQIFDSFVESRPPKK